MKIFKVLKNYLFAHNMSSAALEITDNYEQLKDVVAPIEETIFESDSLAPISEGHFLDTTSPLAVAKYKNNLKLLVEHTRQVGRVEQFKLIRNDEFFPYDWEWRVSSNNTGIEKTGSYFSYQIRETMARDSLMGPQDNKIKIPPSRDALLNAMSKLDRNIGLIYSGVKFRSTKHFTVNTPLSYTGEYNNVESERNFTVIDDMHYFLESGYGYSADYRDAYLDVTHESLKISENAIVLIAEDRYRDIMNNPVIASQLHQRRVIVYRGDEALAINMLLSEQGVLPARPGNRYMIYDTDIRDILERSMQELCMANDLEYAKGHGNINGVGGHFSDLYDKYNKSTAQDETRFIDFLQQKFPEYKDLIIGNILHSQIWAERVIDVIGVNRLLEVIDEYNMLAEKEFRVRFEQYKMDRSTITPEISHIFKQTVAAIKRFYLNEQDSQMPEEVRIRLQELICLFYHAEEVQNQLLAANEICAIFGVSLASETVMGAEFNK